MMLDLIYSYGALIASILSLAYAWKDAPKHIRAIRRHRLAIDALRRGDAVLNA